MNRLAVLLLSVCFAACVPRAALNSECSWRTEIARPLTIGEPDDRRHLDVDVEIAEELGIRYGDSFKGRRTLEVARHRRDDCTATLFAEIARIHHVDAGDIARARGRRDVRLDVGTMVLSIALLFSVASHYVAGRVFSRFFHERRTALVVAVVMSVVLT
jgi:hypothetical protein